MFKTNQELESNLNRINKKERLALHKRTSEDEPKEYAKYKEYTEKKAEEAFIDGFLKAADASMIPGAGAPNPQTPPQMPGQQMGQQPGQPGTMQPPQQGIGQQQPPTRSGQLFNQILAMHQQNNPIMHSPEVVNSIYTQPGAPTQPTQRM